MIGFLKRRRKLVIFVVLLLAAAVASAPYLKKKKDGTGPAGETTEVRVENVVRGELAEVIQAPGEIQPKTKVSISAKVAARIVELPFDEGSTVTRGNPAANPPTTASVLVRLDATDLEAALRSARARHAAQRAQVSVAWARIAGQKAQIQGRQIMLANADRELRRELELFRHNKVSQSTVDEARRKYDQERTELEAAMHALAAEDSALTATLHSLDASEADITKASEDLSYATIVSPIDGVITKLNAKVGELVMTGTMNNAGTVILEVADLRTMMVETRIDENDIAAVRPGQEAQVMVQAYHDRKFTGKVTSVALASKEVNKEKNFTAQILIETNGERILCGLTADVDIETSRHKGVLKVPSQAVLGRPTDELPAAIKSSLTDKERNEAVATVVCKYVGGKAVMTPVRVGVSDATHTIVETGLAENDRIITGPFKVLEKITHDQVVRDEKETTATKTAKAPPDETTGTEKK